MVIRERRSSIRRGFMARRCVGAVVMAMVLFLAFSCSTKGSRTPQQVRDDEAITREIRSLLSADRTMSGTDITVRTFNGEVTLQGTVADALQMRRAAEIAKEADGVVNVINWLEVNRPRFFQRR
jgi:hypothetical protein